MHTTIWDKYAQDDSIVLSLYYSTTTVGLVRTGNNICEPALNWRC